MDETKLMVVRLDSRGSQIVDISFKDHEHFTIRELRAVRQKLEDYIFSKSVDNSMKSYPR